MRRLRHGDRRRGRALLKRDFPLTRTLEPRGPTLGNAPRAALWLLVRGRADRPLDRHVRTAELRRHSTSKRPSVQRGDLGILYAAVWQAVFAVVEVVGEPENDPGRTRWSWRFAIRPLTVVADLDAAPAVEEAGVLPQSLWRHSHIRLTPEQFETARALIERAK